MYVRTNGEFDQTKISIAQRILSSTQILHRRAKNDALALGRPALAQLRR